MKVVLLGTAGYHPNAQRHTACVMLPGLGIVLDAGTGLFRVRERLETESLDIFLSHGHLDHVVGLSFLFDTLWDTPIAQARVHGRADVLNQLREHLFHPTLFPAEPPINWCPLTGPLPLEGQGELSYFPLEHPGGSLGYCLTWPDRKLAYVTDTTARADADYLAMIQGADLLLHECNFQDGWQDHAELTGHSCTSAVAEVARLAEVKRLVLIHTNPLDDSEDPVDLKRARSIFPATELGHDLDELEF